MRVEIGDGGGWQFVNGRWSDGAAGGAGTEEATAPGILGVEAEQVRMSGTGLQGAHFAFNTRLCYRDCTVSFAFALRGHTDAGIILRARDPSHFYLLHFPNCAQASRAQHFWVALSKMDDSGYLRRIEMAMIPRVPSTRDLWLQAQVRIDGPQLSVRVGDYGRFDAVDHTFAGPGCVGLFQFGAARIRDVQITGVPHEPPVWNNAAEQPVNWYHPLPTGAAGWQQPIDIKRFDDGELLMLVNLQPDTRDDHLAQAVPHLTRSTNGGRNWSPPEPLHIGETKSSWAPARLHITPGGRLIGITPGPDYKLVSESADRGRTWQPVGKTNLHVGPPQDPPAQSLSPAGLLNLTDGSLLGFQLLGLDLHQQDYQLFTWGSHHCQGFCTRSDDDGATWSPSVNLDTPGNDDDGAPLAGNLDFTEASAVQLESGRILAFIRPIYSPTMWETWSDDGGRTWGPAVRGPFPGYAAPNMVRTTSGALLIAHRLPGLTVHCSLDDGVTWDQGTMIDTGLWAMGSMVEIEPDVVLYVYWDSFEGLARAQHLRVGAGGLEPVR